LLPRKIIKKPLTNEANLILNFVDRDIIEN